MHRRLITAGIFLGLLAALFVGWNGQQTSLAAAGLLNPGFEGGALGGNPTDWEVVQPVPDSVTVVDAEGPAEFPTYADMGNATVEPHRGTLMLRLGTPERLDANQNDGGNAVRQTFASFDSTLDLSFRVFSWEPRGQDLVRFDIMDGSTSVGDLAAPLQINAADGSPMATCTDLPCEFTMDVGNQGDYLDSGWLVANVINLPSDGRDLTVSYAAGSTNDSAKATWAYFDNVNTRPVAKFGFGPTDPAEGDVIQFFDLSYDTDSDIVSWEWTINGETTTAQNPVYLFEDEGLYSASLTVTDAEGASTTVSTGSTASDGDPIPALNVVNAPPLVNALDVERLGSRPAQLVGRFIDPGIPDVHTAEWQIGDNPPATVEEENDPLLSTGLVTGELTTAGSTNGSMSVDDGDGGIASDSFIVSTVPDDDAARTRHEPNNLPTDGRVVPADASYISFLQEQGDVDVFEIKQVDNQDIKAGSEILVTASGLPADYDLAIIAETPGTSTAGFSRIGLSTLGFSRIGFSRIGESALGYSRIGFSRIGFSRIGFSRIGFSRIGLNTFGTSGVSWADMGFSRIGFSRIGYSRIGNDVTAVDVTLDDIGLNGLPDQNLNVVDFSAARGVSDETAWARSTEAGTKFYAVVFGANEAHSYEDPYTLSVEVMEPSDIEFDLGAACQGEPLVTEGSTNVTSVLHDYDNPGTPENDAANSLFVIQEQRFREIYGLDQAAWDAFLAGAVGVAQMDNVRGDIISVPSDVYDTWDSNPCSIDAANSVVTQIRNIVQTPPWNTVEHLQVLGNDQVVPFRRMQDHAIIGNEADYLLDSLQTPGSPLWVAILEGYMLTDHYIADDVLDPWQGDELPVPDRAVARLVETPDEISAAFQAFIDSGGVLEPSTGLVTGYDFFDDGANAIASNLGSQLPDVDTLIDDTWTADDLRCRMLDEGADPACRAPDVSSPNAHFTHYLGISANGFAIDDFSDSLFASDVANAGGGVPLLGGALIFTMGCHAGFNAPDDLSEAPQDGFDPGLDFAQAAARQQAIWVASTGFGIGDDEGIAGTEEIMGIFADNLMNSGLTAGEAMAETLQDYVLAQNPLTVYDVKSSVQTTFYGLSMYSVDPEAAAAGPAPLLLAAPTVENVGYEFSLTTVDETSAVTSVTSSHSIESHAATNGTYLTADGDAQATIGRAVQPRVVEDLDERHPYAGEPPPIHGLMVIGGTYADTADFDPLLSRRQFEWERGVYEPQECLDRFSPAQPVGVNSLRGQSSTDQALVVVPGQFRCTSGDAPTVVGVERLWSDMTVEILRCSSIDVRGPVIHRVDVRGVNAASEITVKASDESGLSRIVALRVAGGTITPFEMTLSGETHGQFVINVPTSGQPQEVLYLQVEDTQCNTSVHTAKAGYLAAVSVDAGADRIFTPGATDFTATITNFTSLFDDVTFEWDFGDGTTLAGVLSPADLSTVPVTIDALGNATFTVSHTYTGAVIPEKATVRIDEGRGGTGYDDVVFTVGCDPAGDSPVPAADILDCSMSNSGDDVTVTLTMAAPIDSDLSYRVYITSPVNTLIKYGDGKTQGPKGTVVTVSGNEVAFTFKASKAKIPADSTINWYAEIQSGIPGEQAAGKLDRAPNSSTFSYTLQ